MLISSYQERYARSTEKIRVLLNFLKEETYSDFQIIKLLFDFKSDRPLYRLLEKVEKMGLIQKHVHESRASRISLWGITADGLISLPDGRLIAVETERRIKTKARYQSIMASHLLAISDKKWRYAFYVAPDEAKKRALKIIFDSIASVIVKNQHVQLEAKHRDVFRFYTLDELKNLELDNYA